MTLDKLRAHADPRPFHEAKKLEEGGRKIISCSFADRLLVEGLIPSPIGRFWTGTIVAYPGSGMPFKHELLFHNRPVAYVLDTSEFRGEKNAALVFDDYDIVEEGRFRVFRPKDMVLVPRFPQENGWYGLHETGVPILNCERSRFLWRWEAARVGPVVRSQRQDGNWANRDIFMNQKPSASFGAVILEP